MISMLSNVWEHTHVLFENTTFRACIASAHWREQRPADYGDLDSSVTGELGRLVHIWNCFWFYFYSVSHTWFLLHCVLNGTLCRYNCIADFRRSLLSHILVIFETIFKDLRLSLTIRLVSASKLRVSLKIPIIQPIRMTHGAIIQKQEQ
jgi:hypothetical protein